MIGDSRAEYIFIRIAVCALRYTTPLCVLLLVLFGFGFGFQNLSSYILVKLLVFYVILDIIFYFTIWRPYLRRNTHPSIQARHPPPLSRAERNTLFRRCLVHNPDPARYLRIWFLGADHADIRRDNVREFVLWAFFDLYPGQETSDESDEADDYVDQIERWSGRTLESGKGPATSLRVTLDAVETRYRTWGWYGIVLLVDLATHALFWWRGFKYFPHGRPQDTSESSSTSHTGGGFLDIIPPRPQALLSSPSQRSPVPGLSYWYRPHTARNKRPVVFLHGIGIGLSTYIPYLAGLNGSFGTLMADTVDAEDDVDDDGEIGIIAVELLPVSFRLTGQPPPRKDEFLLQLTSILAHHGWVSVSPSPMSAEDSGFVLSAHSYGTALATHVVRSPILGPQVAATVLIDPVSVCLHLPDVAYNFTRRKPQRANEWQLWYFASMDPSVATCLGRHFFWKEAIVWKEDLLERPSAGSVCDGNQTSGGGDLEAVEFGAVASQHHQQQSRRRRRVAVSLAERDLIVDTLSVGQYLADGDEWLLSSMEDGQEDLPPATVDNSPRSGGFLTNDGVELLWFPQLDHAQVFDSKEGLERLCRLTRRYCTT